MDTQLNWRALTDPDFTPHEVKKWLDKRDKGKAADWNGWSPDSLKTYLKLTGDTEGLTAVINAIAKGRFNDNVHAREALTRIRGVALKKSPDDMADIRPIGIGNLFLAIASGLITHRAKTDLRALAGPTCHSVGTACGPEVAAIILTAALDVPGTVVAQADGSNAYGSAERSKLLQTAAKVPATTPYTALRLGFDPIYSFEGAAAPIEITMRQGGPQGDSLMGPLYSAAQAPHIREGLAIAAATEAPVHTHVVIADDIGYVGTLKSALAASKAVAATLANNFGVRQSSTHVYSPGPLTVDQLAELQAAGAVHDTDGTVYAGTPIGTASFVRAFAQERADSLIETLALAEELAAHGDNAAIQEVIRWIKLTQIPSFSWVMRVCDPDLVRDIAAKADDQIFHTVIRMLGLSDCLNASSPEQQARARALFHLPTSLSGCGFPSLAIIADAAYVGAKAQALSLAVAHNTGLGLIAPAPGDPCPPFLRPYVAALTRLTASLPAAAVKGLDVAQIWTTSVRGAQRALSEALHIKSYNNMKLALPQGSTFQERLIRNLVLGGKSEEAGSWLTAHPLNHKCRMSNSDLADAYARRLGINLTGLVDGLCGLCAAPSDATGGHALVCGRNQPLRSTAHTDVKLAVQAIAREAGDRVVNEPFVADDFPRKAGPEGAAGMGTMMKRADVGITRKNNLAGTRTLIDVHITATTKTAKPTVAYATAGDTAKIGEKTKTGEYAAWDIPPTHLVPFVIESTGALGQEAKALLFSIAERSGPATTTAYRYRRYCEMISVTVQKSLAAAVKRLRWMGPLREIKNLAAAEAAAKAAAAAQLQAAAALGAESQAPPVSRKRRRSGGGPALGAAAV